MSNVTNKNPRPKIYRGELFDITITSYNNSYGNKKIINSLEYGINFPLDYYIDELQKIIRDNPTDDKRAKREKRLTFLKICNGKIIYSTFFNYLINYLNGGYMNIKNSYNDQPLIIILAGGNIISIFFNIIKLLNEKDDISNIIDLFDITKISIESFEEFKKILLDIKTDLLNDNLFKKKIEDDDFHQYSDLDFNLLPKKLDSDFFTYEGGVKRKTESELLDPGKQQTLLQPRSKVLEEKKKIQDAQKYLLEKQETLRKQLLKEKNDIRKKEAQAEKMRLDKEKRKLIKDQQDKKKSELKKKQQHLESIEKKNDNFLKYTQERYISGFLLCRIKSSFNCLDNIMMNLDSDKKEFINFENEISILNSTIQNTSQNCNYDDLNKLNTTNDKLIAHLANDSWLSSGVSNLCLQFVKKLLSKKLFTKKCTDANTLIIARSNILNMQLQTYYDYNNEFAKIKNMINYITLLTSSINNDVLNKSNILYNNHYENANNLFDNFYDLESIIYANDGILLKFVKQIIDKFYSLQETTVIIENIKDLYSDCRIKPTSYQLYLSSETSKYKQYIDDKINLNENISNYGEGTFITLNLIKSNNEDNSLLNGIDESLFNEMEIESLFDRKHEPLSKQELLDLEKEAQKEIDIFLAQEDTYRDTSRDTDMKEYAKGIKLKKKVRKKNIFSKLKSKISNRITKFKKNRKSRKSRKRFKKFVKKVMRLTKKCKNKKYKNTRKCKKFLQIVK